MARKNTKDWYIEQIKAEFAAYKILSEELRKRIAQGDVNGGCLFVYGPYSQYSYRWFWGDEHGATTMKVKAWKHCKLYGTGKRQATLLDFKYYLEQVKKDHKKLADFLANTYQRGYRKWHLDNPEGHAYWEMQALTVKGEIAQ